MSSYISPRINKLEKGGWKDTISLSKTTILISSHAGSVPL